VAVYDAAMHTRLTEILDVEHPVMLAGMGGVSYHRLVAAVSEAGGFGCMGASTMRFDEMVDEIARVREQTAKPFGVDLLTAAPQDLDAKVNAIIDGGATVFVAGLGVPRDVVELCHRRNVLVVNMCGKVRHAVAAVEAGCDIVVAQGTEAGGHTGQVATMALVPQVVDAVGPDVPVLAAGGIADGRQMAGGSTKRALAGIIAAALRDELNGRLGREPHYIPVLGKPGDTAALTQPGQTEAMEALIPSSETNWENRYTPRVALRLRSYRPFEKASRVRCPLLVCVSAHDTITLPGPALAGAEAAPLGESATYECGHFDVYAGEWFERAVSDQIAFLGRALADSAVAQRP